MSHCSGAPCVRIFRTRTINAMTCIVVMIASSCSEHKAAPQNAGKQLCLQNPDAALDYYERASKADPANAQYRTRAMQCRLEASQAHIQTGRAARADDDLQSALAEFRRALAIDPSSSVADQEIRTTRALLDALSTKRQSESLTAPPQAKLAEGPPELKPLSNAPINIRMSNDARIVYETVGKLAGLTVIFDPDFPARRISVELTDATIAQALDIVSIEAKAFWKPVTQNIILIVPDQPQKRRDYEEQVVQVFYLSNTVLPQDLTEIVTGLRQLLDLKRIQQVNSQNTLLVRDTPDKLAIAERIIRALDNAKPEVVLQVEVLQARRDRVHELGIAPETSATVSFVNPDSSSSSSNSNKLPLNKLLSSGDYNVTLPGATVHALLTDSATRIIQNPELRSIDGQPAKLRVGDRVPVATGSFQAGSSTGINPLVNTQFQYIDVGVNADITPRIHPDREVSLKIAIEVSSVTGTSTIGGIQQPIISQRKIEHDIRLKEGEASILGGLFEHIDTKTLNGWPGFAHIPLLRYLFSSESTDHQENEVLVILIPRIVRLPALTPGDLRPLSSGTESNVQVRRKESLQTPVLIPPTPPTDSSPH
jgi:general secretion pathway protein D